jgi:hypothetical protein
MNQRQATITAIAIHVALMLTAYFGLVTVFDFPDILRTEPGNILAKFRANRALVQGFYLAFTWSQVAFVCVVLAMRERLGEHGALTRAATHLGVIAGFAQAVGFSRWPFVVGSLADRFAQDPDTTLVVLDALHRAVGVAVGEHLFFCFEALWAGATALHLFASRTNLHGSRPTAWSLLTIGIAIGIYSLEQLGGPFAVLGPLNVYAHGALLFWLIGFAVREAVQRRLRVWETAALIACWLAIVSG